ncbi:E3 ubiquitin-protein ligase SHPRH [Hordeum vulgare]|nr:E3 ubiquitin-protein ligase SHPRH [Hordeum vulgare]
MGRIKSRPSRARALGACASTAEPDAPSPSAGSSKSKRAAKGDVRRDVLVEAGGGADGHPRDLAELVLRDVRLGGEGRPEGAGLGAPEGERSEENGGRRPLRLRVRDAPEDGFRLGHWPVVPSDCVLLEYHAEGLGGGAFVSGCFDGPDEGVSGLAHLVSLGFVELRVCEYSSSPGDGPAPAMVLRVRVEVMDRAFGACESLLEVARQPWRKSLMNMMAWVRPEVTTLAVMYGMDGLVPQMDGNDDRDFAPKSDSQFDLAAFYEAVKPSMDAEQLEDELPDLLPHLRPYQLRAANWMVQREKGNTTIPSPNEDYVHYAPYCVPIDFISNNSRMFYNPFNGNVSLQPEPSPPYVYGGILADEMGLGKTVELLACIFAHRSTFSTDCSVSGTRKEIDLISRPKRDRVECVCGAASESSAYKGIWVQCDTCDAWQHADCVGYSPKKDLTFDDDDVLPKNEESTMKSKSRRQKRAKFSIAETEENYICAVCLELAEAAQTTIFSHATLIVCPSPILAQWHSEITRHTRPGSLDVRIYEGARNLDSANQRNDLSEISTADVVLTTYDVLKEDLSHDSDRHDGDRRFLRFQKRYPVIPTVLTRVHWWRLCLDEAQMVESSKTSVTEMAMRLNAQHRWCITGTPIQRRLDDLFGLLCFLRTSPFDTYRWWVDVIRDPYERGDMIAMNYTHKFFKEIMWRSSKIHVSRELQLPPQEECFSWLIFSSIEEYFYQKQHATCMDHAHEIIKRLRNDANRREVTSDSNALSNVYLSNSDTAKLLVPLLKLRQACCHPQVGSSGLCSLQHTPLSMEEILQVTTLNKELQNQGMGWWLYALDCIEKSKDATDDLFKKINSLSTKSTTGLGTGALSSSRVQTIAGLKYTIQAGIDSLEGSRQQLMVRLLEIDKTMDNPREEDIESQRYCPKCYDGTGSLCIQCELDELSQGYEARLFVVKKSNNDSVIASVEEAQDLQRRTYELNHFFRNKKTNEGSEVGGNNVNPRSVRENIQVYRHPSQTETALRAIRSHSRRVLGKQYVEIGTKHLLLFEAMRKEFSLARSLSIAQNQLLRAHDEIKMSISRLQLKENDDEPSAVNIVTREELIPYNVQFTSDKFLALTSLARIRGQLRYLKGLMLPKSGNIVATATSFPATEQIGSEISNESCPVCQEKILEQKMVFQCGHSMCCKCCLYLTDRAAGKHKKWIMCPTCRQRTYLENVAFVVEKQSENADKQADDLIEAAISVQGSYGTKIEAVTRRILNIISTDGAAKILVFSSWNDVLDVLEHSLAANNVCYARMKGGRKSQLALCQFKGLASSINGEKAKKAVSKMRPVQVLLMLIQHGANGLNLLEAQHVILLEPLLNPSAEAQAISRIHRVGQDKSTFIHRFIVKKTIEDSIYKMNRGRAVCSTINRKSKNFKDELALTLKDVESLFPVAASDQPPEEDDKDHGDTLRSLPPSLAAGLAAQMRVINGAT